MLFVSLQFNIIKILNVTKICLLMKGTDGMNTLFKCRTYAYRIMHASGLTVGGFRAYSLHCHVFDSCLSGPGRQHVVVASLCSKLMKCSRRYSTVDAAWGNKDLRTADLYLCTKFDDMCRTRILNYIARQCPAINKEKMFQKSRCILLEGETKWKAVLEVPISNSNVVHAIGYAECEKDAELACTAHAEAILDSLNIPLFLLASGQKKYAEQKRRCGKIAPLHGDKLKNLEDIVLPLPHVYVGLDSNSRSKLLNTKIRYVRTQKDEELESEESESGKYVVVSLPLQSQANASNYIMSPQVYDTNAVNRMHRLYHSLFGIALEAAVQIKEVVRQRETSKGTSSYIEYHTAVTLPLDEKTFGKRVAMGVSRMSRFSMSLCAMHMELIFDAIGIPVFKREDLQRTHAEGVRRVGRWAPLPGDGIRPNASSPPPLKRAVSKFTGLNNQNETDMLQNAILKEVDVIDSSDIKSLKKIHFQQGWPSFDEKSSITKAVNRGMFSSHRCVTAVYKIPLNESICGERIAVGVSTNAQSADILCCMHAMKIIKTLNVLRNYKGASKETPNPPIPCLLNDNLGSQTNEVPECRDSTYDSCISIELTKDSLPNSAIGKVKANTQEQHSDIQKEKECSLYRTSHNIKLATTYGPPQPAEKPLKEKFYPIQWQTETADGYTLIRFPCKMTSQYALIRANESDELSRIRVSKYLTNNSSRSQAETLGQIFKSSKILMVDPDDQNNYQVYYRSRASLHIVGVGTLVATGESYMPDDAEVLACMHFEMILDHVGGQFFKRSDLQSKRRELTLKSGRWAPAPCDCVRPDSKYNLPPPLRRRPAERMTKEFKFLIAEEILEDSKDRYDLVPITEYREAYLYAVNSTIQRYSRFKTSKANLMTNMQFSRLRVSEAKRIYQASAILDIDEKYGERTAIGLARDRATAEKMCIIHATRIFDALGIPIFSSEEDSKIVNLSMDAPDRTVLPSCHSNQKSIASPLPVKEKNTIGYSRPILPANNILIDTSEATSTWKTYVLKVTNYLNAIQEEKDDTYLKQGKIPRTGDQIVDEALEAVESNRVPISGCQKTLQVWCDHTGLQFPHKINFRSLRSHSLVHSYFSIPGYPEYVAHGLHQLKPISIKRAVAHCVYMLTNLDRDFRNGFKKAENEKSQAKNWDFINHCLTSTGERALLHIYGKVTRSPQLDIFVKFDKDNMIYNISLTHNDPSVGPITTTSQHGTKQGALELARKRLIGLLIKRRDLTKGNVSLIIQLLQRFPSLDTNFLIALSLCFKGYTLASDLLKELTIPTSGIAPLCDDSIPSSPQCIPSKKQVNNVKFSPYTLDPAKHADLLKKIESRNYFDKYQQQRAKLPINEIKSEIISQIRENRVTVICSAAGSGKTTQIPQMILDDSIKSGRGCRIAVTQPRRISAISIAKRVAQERLEDVGDSVGYMVRLDVKTGKSLNFMTSGLLFRLIRADFHLLEYSHIILDEVHERDIYTDLLLALLRDLLKLRSDLKLIVMSATMHASTFSSYFDGAPVIHCNKGIYPVDIRFLEDISSLAKAKKIITASTMNLCPAPELLSGSKSGTSLIRATTSIDYRLLTFLVEHVVSNEDVKGSCVLIFLPGWGEIITASEALSNIASCADISHLHSSVGPKAQMDAFTTPAPDRVKIILTTNICESSITIPEVRVVIDCGRLKEKMTIHSVNATVHQSVLTQMHASRANCVQRSGRAGRTQRGICYRMFTKEHFDLLPQYQTPEITRRHLDDICLSLLSLGISKPEEYLLTKMIDPPSHTAIQSAMLKLKDTGAVDALSRLTSLGYHLDPLPLEPCIGKMVLFGVALGCLDLALTLAAAMTVSPFDTSLDAREGVQTNKDILTQGCRSDHLSSVNAYNKWANSQGQCPSQAKIFIEEHCLSQKKLEEMSLIKHQIHSVLSAQNYLSDSTSTTQRHCFVDTSIHSTLSGDVTLAKALLSCGLYPNIAIKTARSYRAKCGDSTIDTCSVLGSIDSMRTAEKFSPYYMFSAAHKQNGNVHHSQGSTSYRLSDVTNVSFWSLLLCGIPLGSMEYIEGINLLIVDQWLFAVIDKDTFQIVRDIKLTLSWALDQKLENPKDVKAENNLRQVQRCFVEMLRISEDQNLHSERGSMQFVSNTC